jgi:hypothetical protein
VNTFLDACYTDVGCTGALVLFALPLGAIAWITLGILWRCLKLVKQLATDS